LTISGFYYSDRKLTNAFKNKEEFFRRERPGREEEEDLVLHHMPPTQRGNTLSHVIFIRHQRLMPVILATWEDIRRIMLPGQHRQKSFLNPISMEKS
jgi:hypothetical protein